MPRKLQPDFSEDDHEVDEKDKKPNKKSLAASARWAKEGAKEAHAKKIKAKWQDETSVYNTQEYRDKLRDIMIDQWQDETSIFNSQEYRDICLSREYRDKLRAAALGIRVEDLQLFDEGRLVRPVPVRPAIVEVTLEPAEYARRVGGSIDFTTEAMINGYDVYPGTTFQRDPHHRTRTSLLCHATYSNISCTILYIMCIYI